MTVFIVIFQFYFIVMHENKYSPNILTQSEIKSTKMSNLFSYSEQKRYRIWWPFDPQTHLLVDNITEYVKIFGCSFPKQFHCRFHEELTPKTKNFQLIRIVNQSMDTQIARWFEWNWLVRKIDIEFWPIFVCLSIYRLKINITIDRSNSNV